MVFGIVFVGGREVFDFADSYGDGQAVAVRIVCVFGHRVVGVNDIAIGIALLANLLNQAADSTILEAGDITIAIDLFGNQACAECTSAATTSAANHIVLKQGLTTDRINLSDEPIEGVVFISCRVPVAIGLGQLVAHTIVSHGGDTGEERYTNGGCNYLDETVLHVVFEGSGVAVLIGRRDAVVAAVVGLGGLIAQGVDNLHQPVAQVIFIKCAIVVAVDDLDDATLAVVDIFRHT